MHLRNYINSGKNLVKSEVDEKNLDEEISKIKDKLASKIVEREKTRKEKAPANDDDDDFFNYTVRKGRQRVEDDGMDVDERPNAIKKRVVHDISDDDEMEMPTSKKPRKVPAKASKKPAVSRARQSSELSKPPPVTRKTPARAAASHAKKVRPKVTCVVMPDD